VRVHRLLNRYIDLDHVLAVSDALFVNRMGSGGWLVEFSLTMAFSDRPLAFSAPLVEGTRIEHDGAVTHDTCTLSTEVRFVRVSINRENIESNYQLKVRTSDGSVVWKQSHQLLNTDVIIGVERVQREIIEPFVKTWKEVRQPWLQ
jgi:hypothetical protein